MNRFISRLSVAAGLLSLTCGAFAANTTNLRESAISLDAVREQIAVQDLAQQNVRAGVPGPEVAVAISRALGLANRRQKLDLLSSHFDKVTNLREIKYQQVFEGVPLWGYRVMVTRNANGRIKWLHGVAVNNIAQDVQTVQAQFGSIEALELARNHNASIQGFKPRSLTYGSHSVKLRIWLDQADTAHLVYVVEYLAYPPSDSALPLQPVYIIDAHSGRILRHWNGLQTVQQIGTGDGGNRKIGRYFYGQERPRLHVTKRGGQCLLQSARVVTADAHGRRSSSGTVISFSCPKNNGISVNGGYGIDNDAHYYGHVIIQMYKQWYNTTALGGRTLRMIVNIGPIDNAFWQSGAMHFGNGQTSFYPLSSGINVGAHEVSHGFTQYNSGLIYSGEPGGLNESFSDIMGEAAEYFYSGSVDWYVGGDIDKRGNGLRSFRNPRYANVDRRPPSRNPHVMSGPFNKAYYLLGTTSGWNPRSAAAPFVEANQSYWGPRTGFQRGAQGVVDAAEALGYNPCEVAEAFYGIGVNQLSHGSCGGEPPGGGDVIELQNGVAVSVSGQSGEDQYYKLQVPADATDLSFQVNAGTGDADLYASHGAKPTTSTHDCRSINPPGENDACSFSTPQAGTWYVLLHAASSYANATLTGTYATGGDNPPPDGGSCEGVPVWDASTIYTEGDAVRYNGKLYTANWWNRGANPEQNSGQYAVWTLEGDCSGDDNPPPGDNVTVLQNGVPVTVSGDQSSNNYYTLDVPADATGLTFQTSGGSGNVSLYVLSGSKPTPSTAQCTSATTGNGESCSFASPQAGVWFVLLQGAYSNVTLQGSYTTGGDNPPPTGCEAWAVGNTYQAGDVVSYEGQTYTAVIAHTAYSPSWNPVAAPTLWNPGGSCD